MLILDKVQRIKEFSFAYLMLILDTIKNQIIFSKLSKSYKQVEAYLVFFKPKKSRLRLKGQTKQEAGISYHWHHVHYS